MFTRRDLAGLVAGLGFSAVTKLDIVRAQQLVIEAPVETPVEAYLTKHGRIGLMHYVKPDAYFSGMTISYGYWATSYIDSIDEVPQWGDSFCHYPQFGADTDRPISSIVLTAEQQREVEVASYTDAMSDLIGNFHEVPLYMRLKTGYNLKLR